MMYKIAKTISGHNVKTSSGDVLASFSNDQNAERLLGKLIGALAIGGDDVFDETKGSFIVGTMDQLLNG